MYIADSKLTPRNFYKGLLEQLGCEAKFYRGDSKRQLQSYAAIRQYVDIQFRLSVGTFEGLFLEY